MLATLGFLMFLAGSLVSGYAEVRDLLRTRHRPSAPARTAWSGRLGQPYVQVNESSETGRGLSGKNVQLFI